MPALVHLKPFRFDRDFGLPMAEAADLDPASPPLRPPGAFSEDDVARARTEGFAAGREAGRVEAAAETAERTASILERLAADLACLSRELVREDAEITRQATALAVALCRKVLPAPYQAAAAASVCQLVADILPRVALLPQVRVRVAAGLVAAVEAPLAAIKAEIAFPGQLEVTGDPSLAAGDCRIEWTRGGVVRDWNHLWHEIDALIGETVGLEPPEPPSPSPSRGLYPPAQREVGDA